MVCLVSALPRSVFTPCHSIRMWHCQNVAVTYRVFFLREKVQESLPFWVTPWLRPYPPSSTVPWVQPLPTSQYCPFKRIQNQVCYMEFVNDNKKGNKIDLATTDSPATIDPPKQQCIPNSMHQLTLQQPATLDPSLNSRSHPAAIDPLQQKTHSQQQQIPHQQQ